MMNATMLLRHDPSWGYLVNGSWDGIVGYLERDEADMGSTAVLYTEERAKVVHYLIMTTPTKLGFVFRQPPLSSVRNVFVMPFTRGVWLGGAALLVLCGALLLAALRWERRRRPGEQVAWSDVVLLSLGALCQQGSPLESRGTPGRIVSLQMFIFVIFVYTSYSACIVALLQSSTNTINTLRDLLDSRLKLAVHDIVYNRYFFERAEEPVRKAIYQRKIAPPGVPPRFIGLADGVERMRKGMFAFHFEVGTGYKLVLDSFDEDEKCGLTRIPYIQVVDAYQVIQKNSVYKEIMAVAYNKLLERGFQKRNWNRYYTSKPECNSRGSSFMSVGLIDCYPVLVVLLAGLVAAVAVLLLEVLAHRREMSSHGIPTTTHNGCENFPSLTTIPSQACTLNVLDAECGCAFSVLKQAHDQGRSKHRTRWLLTDAPREALDLLDSLDAALDSELTVASVRRGEEEGVSLLEVYRTAAGSSATRAPVGEWSAERGLAAPAPRATAARRANLHRAVIGAATANKADHQDDVKLQDGLVVRHLKLIMKPMWGYKVNGSCDGMMNEACPCSFSLKLITKRTWGYKVNWSWDDMVSEVLLLVKLIINHMWGYKVNSLKLIIKLMWGYKGNESCQKLIIKLMWGYKGNGSCLKLIIKLMWGYKGNGSCLKLIIKLMWGYKGNGSCLKLIIKPTWGYKVNGSWDGVVSEVVAGNVEIAAAGMLLYRERQEVMDYAVMTTPTKLGFVFRQPPLSSVRNVFTMPFSRAVWGCAAGVVALCALMLYAALTWERRWRLEEEPAVSWSDVVLLSLGAVCQQGSPLESRGTPGRIVSLLLFVAVIFLYTSYSAYIVALLQSTTNSIRTLGDLLHSRLDLAVENIVYNRYYFEAEKEPVRRELYRRKIAPPGQPPRFIDLEEGIRRMRRGFFAFHFETGKGFKLVQETFTEEEKCGLSVISYIQVVDAYMALQRGTPYREVIVLAYRKLMERGFQKRAWRRYYTDKPECTVRGSSFVHVGLLDCYPAALVLLLGALCSLGALLLEVAASRRAGRHLAPPPNTAPADD
ncbi:uncharacterized protein LOC134532250 [Bacillus rossius redtenbacheri]|uniref:uncharacterized protein LOC134532250 n=1 Tax=Bacillus rossius redtenbacheri TaxID=93214 RepID=UPI002FDD18DD